MTTHEDYLATAEVAAFVGWFEALIVAGDGSFVQRYTPAKGGPEFSIERFTDAYHQYHFAGKTFAQTSTVLAQLAGRLQAALLSGDQADVLRASLRIFDWGGVTNSTTVKWLLDADEKGELVQCLQSATNAITRVDDSLIRNFNNQLPYRSDSAATKLYALIDSQSAIYDDRVASGLGWLVVQHAESQGYKAVPEVLRFTVKSGKKTNPSKTQLRLPVRSSGLGTDHALSNLRFNWILQELAATERVAQAFGLECGEGVIRAIEAALFMVGKRFDVIKLSPP